MGALAQGFNEMGSTLQAKITMEQETTAQMEQFLVVVKRVLASLAKGNLTDQMPDACLTKSCEGDLDQIRVSLNAAITNLNHSLATVHEAAENVTTGAEEITKGNEDLAQRTSQQAASLEETSSAMEEMTSTVKQNADSARQANQLAIVARDVANKGWCGHDQGRRGDGRDQ